MLVTDALAIDTEGAQPKKEVDMTIPIHTKHDRNDIVVMASRDDHPDSVDDWEIIEPADDANNTDSISFKTNHFSL